MKMVKNFDLIGPELKISINGDARLKTKVGGLLTILWIALSILAFCAFGRDILEKKNPQIQLNTKVNADRTFNYNSNNFTIMFAITDNVNLLPIKDIEKKMRLYFNVRNTNATKSVNSSETTLIDVNHDLIPCNSSIVLPGAQNNLLVDVSNYWCVPPNLKYKLVNGLGEGTSQWFRIQMEICVNSTKNNNGCLPLEKIYKEFTTINVHYVISNIIIDGYDYLNPGKENYISGLIKGGSNTWSRNIYWFKGVYYNTDESWILESNRLQTYFQNSLIEAQLYSQPNTNVFFSHLISIVQLGDYYNRNYIKIQGVFAYIGGFISFFKLCFGVIDEMINEKNINLIFENLIFRKPKLAEEKEKISNNKNDLSPNIAKRYTLKNRSEINFNQMNILNSENAKFGHLYPFHENIQIKVESSNKNKLDSNVINKYPKNSESNSDKEIHNSIHDSQKKINNLNENNIKILNKNHPVVNESKKNLELIKVVSIKEFKKELNLSLWKYIFPFLIKKNSEEKKIYDYLKFMNKLRKRYFSFEKIIKTVKNFKILKYFILNPTQSFLFKFSDINLIRKHKEAENLNNNNRFEENKVNEIYREFCYSINQLTNNRNDQENLNRNYEDTKNILQANINKKLINSLNF